MCFTGMFIKKQDKQQHMWVYTCDQGVFFKGWEQVMALPAAAFYYLLQFPLSLAIWTLTSQKRAGKDLPVYFP